MAPDLTKDILETFLRYVFNENCTSVSSSKTIGKLFELCVVDVLLVGSANW
jgi:hypothetical protein